MLPLDATVQTLLKIVQRSEQGDSAVAEIVVRCRADMPYAQRQYWLGEFQSLNQAFLVAAVHQRHIRWIQIYPMTPRNFSSKFESLDSLKVRVRCAFMSLLAHVRWPVRRQRLVHTSTAPAKLTDALLSGLLKGALHRFGRQGWLAT